MEQLCFSKINIGLAICSKRPDGYHDIDTIFQSIMLGDSIYFARHHSVVFSGDAPELPAYMNNLMSYGEENLALKALRAVQEYTGTEQGAAIHLLKRVPPAAGLGGGSGDAAGMIKGLNVFWDLQLTKQEMIALATPLGADVPFLLEGGTARGRGTGGDLKALPEVPSTWMLVVKPKISVSTAMAYRHFQGTSAVTSATIDTIEEALGKGNVEQAFSLAANTFEELPFGENETVHACKLFFKQRGYKPLVTGTGPTVIVYLPSAKDALYLQGEIKNAGHSWLSLITKTKTKEKIV